MTSRPTVLDSAATTNAQMKVLHEQLRGCVAEHLGGATPSTLTISSGSITPTAAVHWVDTEGAAASDDLDNIVMTNHEYGRFLLLRSVAGSTREVTLKHSVGGTGQLVMSDASDIVLSDASTWVLLLDMNTYWWVVSIWYNNDFSSARTRLGLGTAAVEDVGTSTGDVVQLVNDGGSAGLPAVKASNLTSLPAAMGDFIMFTDTKSSGTAGGTFTSGAWQKRTVNTEEIDEDGSASVASDQITLGTAGTYYYEITCPACQVANHQARLHETTGTLTSGTMTSGDDYGTTEYSGVHSTDLPSTTRSVIRGKVTIAGSTVFEVQHRCQTTGTTTGYGVAGGFGGEEVYTIACFWRVD